jgi:hypothetical protein
MALRVLVAGTWANFHQEIPSIIRVLERCINQDWAQFFNKVVQASAGIEESSKQAEAMASEQNIDTAEIRKIIEGQAAAMEALESQLRYVQNALEILANLVADNREVKEPEWEDMDDEDEDEMMHMEQSEPMDEEQQIKVPIKEALVQQLSEMLSLTPPVNVPHTENLVTHILGAFVNLFDYLGSSWASSHVSMLQAIWGTIVQLGAEATDPVLEPLVDALWSLSRILPSGAVPPTEDQIRGVIHLFNTKADLQTACSGVLGYLARAQGFVELNSVSTYCLLVRSIKLNSFFL